MTTHTAVPPTHLHHVKALVAAAIAVLVAAGLAVGLTLGLQGSSTPAHHGTPGIAGVNVFRTSGGSYATKFYGTTITSINARTTFLCSHRNKVLDAAMVRAGLPPKSSGILAFYLYYRNGQPIPGSGGSGQLMNLCGVGP
jgi:hypothetical protein